MAAPFQKLQQGVMQMGNSHPCRREAQFHLHFATIDRWNHMHRRPFGPLVEKRFASLHKAIEVASGLAISPPERSKRQY